MTVVEGFLEPVDLDIEYQQGTSMQIEFQVTVNGVPKDLTNHVGRSQWRRYARSPTAVATPTVTIHDPVNGKFLYELDFASGEAVTLPELVYDVELRDTVSGFKFTPVRGKVIVTREVTKL